MPSNWVICNFACSPLEIYGASVMMSFENYSLALLRSECAIIRAISIDSKKNNAKQKWKIKNTHTNLNTLSFHVFFSRTPLCFSYTCLNNLVRVSLIFLKFKISASSASLGKLFFFASVVILQWNKTDSFLGRKQRNRNLSGCRKLCQMSSGFSFNKIIAINLRAESVEKGAHNMQTLTSVNCKTLVITLNKMSD